MELQKFSTLIYTFCIAISFQARNFQVSSEPLPLFTSESGDFVKPLPFHQPQFDLSQSLEFSPMGIHDDRVHFSPKFSKAPLTRRSVQSDPSSQIGSVCSIFRTFLAAMNVGCRATPPNPSRRLHSDNSMEETHPEAGNVEIYHEKPTSRMESSEELENLDHPSLTLNPPPLEDETKILKDKVTIIVPDRGCPHGQRRDPHRGYCQPVLHFRPYFAHGQQTNVKSKYFYKRYVAVPTLHFILPNY